MWISILTRENNEHILKLTDDELVKEMHRIVIGLCRTMKIVLRRTYWSLLNHLGLLASGTHGGCCSVCPYAGMFP